jgi:cobalt/nickel transport protein
MFFNLLLIGVTKIKIVTLFDNKTKICNMKNLTIFLLHFGLLLLLFATNVNAHFGLLIPSDSMVSQEDSREISLQLAFLHPFESIGMHLGEPASFTVNYAGITTELKTHLKPFNLAKHTAWQTNYRIRKPGVYVFTMRPRPFWEPAEDSYIIHITKTIIAAFGEEEAWDKELGLETEIVPLSRPFGLYTGNIFQGIVKLNGKIVPYAKIEVEFYNIDQKATVSSNFMITQSIKADKNGVFSYAAPASGWWGFAALNSANYKLPFNGEPKEVELGAVIWVKFHDFSKN